MTKNRIEMQPIWDIEQEILDVIDNICQRYHLRYSLAYGTLLGAVRHGGFIPWDDDIDIIMPREDYETFLSVWQEIAPTGYILQNKRIVSDFTQTFSKICKDHTTFLQEETERGKHYHKGFFVDIFPGDRVAPNAFSKQIQYIFCAINLLYSRGYTSGTGGVIGAIEKILMQVPGKLQRKLLAVSEKQIRKWNKDQSLPYMFPATIVDAKKSFPSDMFTSLQKIAYCGKLYSCVSNTDQILRLCYGNYMQLPPPEERVWKHHPLLIDFEHNYEELDHSAKET